MKLKYALSKIHSVKGATTVIASFLSGDFAPIKGQDDTASVDTALEQAAQKYAQY